MNKDQIQETYYLETSAQIRAIAQSTRWRMLNLLIAKPMTGSQLSRILKITRPKAHYHLKILEKVGLIGFVEERLHNNIMERYYRAIAKSFLTDHLLAKAREAEPLDQDFRQTDEALHKIIYSMLSLVKLDLGDPDASRHLLKMNYSYQEDVRLTKTQFQAMKTELSKVVKQFLSYNLSNSIEPPEDDPYHFRFTLLLTPTANEHDLEENAKVVQETKPRSHE